MEKTQIDPRFPEFPKTFKKPQATGRVPASADSADVPLFFPGPTKQESCSLLKSKVMATNCTGALTVTEEGQYVRAKASFMQHTHLGGYLS